MQYFKLHLSPMFLERRPFPSASVLRLLPPQVPSHAQQHRRGHPHGPAVQLPAPAHGRGRLPSRHGAIREHVNKVLSVPVLANVFEFLSCTYTKH